MGWNSATNFIHYGRHGELSTNQLEDQEYVAECPEMGTASQGYTIEEALANLKEATELYLEDFPLSVE